MTSIEFWREMAYLKREAYLSIYTSSPVRTGNLRNSVRVKDLPNGGFEVYIDTKQAPYAIHTLEVWKHQRWRGKRNPNEGWAYYASSQFAEFAKARLGAGE